MIIKIRNKTANTVYLNSENTQLLLANETKLCFYNRPMLLDQTRLRVLLRLDQIEFLDENNAVAVKYNQEYEDKIEGDGDEFVEMLTDCIFEYRADNDDKIYSLKVKIADKIQQLLKTIFEKVIRKGNLTGYSTINFIDALNSKRVTDLLDYADIATAGTAIGNIATDGFFTNNRKAMFKSLCQSVIFE
jgi:hypothetical protein